MSNIFFGAAHKVEGRAPKKEISFFLEAHKTKKIKRQNIQFI